MPYFYYIDKILIYSYSRGWGNRILKIMLVVEFCDFSRKSRYSVADEILGGLYSKDGRMGAEEIR